MDSRKDNGSYIEELQKRSKESRVHTEHQMMGLLIAEALEDPEHKSLYMRLAKKHDPDTLLRIAKDVADREGIENKGAYFMKIVSDLNLLKDGEDTKSSK